MKYNLDQVSLEPDTQTVPVMVGLLEQYTRRFSHTQGPHRGTGAGDSGPDPPYTLISGQTRQPFIHNYVEFSAGSPFNSAKGEILIFKAKDYVQDVTSARDSVHLSLSLYILVERLLLAVPEEFFSALNTSVFESRIRSAMEYMDLNFRKKISITDLSKYVNLSESHFLHLFK